MKQHSVFFKWRPAFLTRLNSAELRQPALPLCGQFPSGRWWVGLVSVICNPHVPSFSTAVKHVNGICNPNALPRFLPTSLAFVKVTMHFSVQIYGVSQSKLLRATHNVFYYFDTILTVFTYFRTVGRNTLKKHQKSSLLCIHKRGTHGFKMLGFWFLFLWGWNS